MEAHSLTLLEGGNFITIVVLSIGFEVDVDSWEVDDTEAKCQ